MASVWEQLDGMRAIIDTARAQDVAEQPEAIRVRYEPYAAAYYPVADAQHVAKHLIETVRAGKSVTGYVSADYGYGKTATAVYLWKRCLDAGLVAVPPFILRNTGDVMRAVKGWLAASLERSEPSLLPRLDALYQERVERAVDDLAREISAQEAIPEDASRRIVQEHIAARRDLTTVQGLLEFLQGAAHLALAAGFGGLVVFADELHEFVRTEGGAAEAIQILSELVKGIRAMPDTPLALMLSMPAEPTEAVIEHQAGDVMQRMREQRTALRLENAYGRGFPAQLWEYLCQASTEPEVRVALEPCTLDALGQLCVRRDLSNGPRTVISAFKAVARRMRERSQPYTPLDLMDDYLDGVVVFEGREAKLTSTVRRLLELPALQDSPERQKAVKLLAAFPQGVGPEAAGPLFPAIEELADREQWLGEHLRQMAGGYVLTGLLERAESRPLVDEIVRGFHRQWHRGSTGEQKVQLVVEGFARGMLPLLFPQRITGPSGFGGHRTLQEDGPGMIGGVLDGCYERLAARFPGRRVRISASTVAHRLALCGVSDTEADLDLRFFLEVAPTEGLETICAGIENVSQSPRIDFHLNLQRTLGREFPPDLPFLGEALVADRTPLAMLLALVMHFDGWLEKHPDVSLADHGMIKAQRDALLGRCLHALLPDAGDSTRISVRGIAATGAGQRLMESLFVAKCEERYPEYRTLRTETGRNQLLRANQQALGKVSLAQRRGQEPLEGTKRVIAAQFGWSPSQFLSYARGLQQLGLLASWNWTGRGDESEAQVVFSEHPLEALLREALQRQGRLQPAGGTAGSSVLHLEEERLRIAARRQGYLPEEVAEALELLILRGYVERHGRLICEAVHDLDAAALETRQARLAKRIRILSRAFPKELERLEATVRRARVRLSGERDEVALDSIQRELDVVEEWLDDFVRQEARRMEDCLSAVRKGMEPLGTTLDRAGVDEQVVGSVGFVTCVDDQRAAVAVQVLKLRGEWEPLWRAAQQVTMPANDAVEDETLCVVAKELTQLQQSWGCLRQATEKVQTAIDGLRQWCELVERAGALRKDLHSGHVLRTRLDGEITTGIVQAFAADGMGALCDCPCFRKQVVEIEREWREEQRRDRAEFDAWVGQYEATLGRLGLAVKVRSLYDPHEPEKSLEFLREDVVNALRTWLSNQERRAEDLLSKASNPSRGEGTALPEVLAKAQLLVREVKDASRVLTPELVANRQGLGEHLGRLQGFPKRMSDIERQLTRREKREPTEQERTLLRALDHEPRRLEDVWRQLANEVTTLDDLFARLQGLCDKGLVAIELRARD